MIFRFWRMFAQFNFNRQFVKEKDLPISCLLLIHCLCVMISLFEFRITLNVSTKNKLCVCAQFITHNVKFKQAKNPDLHNAAV